MAGFYRKIKDTWRSLRNALVFARKDVDAHEELCLRFSSQEPLRVAELGCVESLCKKISEPGCERRIEGRFDVLRKIASDRVWIEARRRRKSKREMERTAEPVAEVKRHRKQNKLYQKKHVLRKDDDVSWGVFPKRYRSEDKTSSDVLERAVQHEKEDNLFLHFGDVSTDEEEAYFSEDNVKKLNEEDGGKTRQMRCNFGGEYNCRGCVEYEIRREYEAREQRNREMEEERSRIRRRTAKERWDARIPRSYSYLEKSMGLDRLMTRYATDEDFEMDDLEDDEKTRLSAMLERSRMAAAQERTDAADDGMDGEQSHSEYETAVESLRPEAAPERTEESLPSPFVFEEAPQPDESRSKEFGFLDRLREGQEEVRLKPQGSSDAAPEEPHALHSPFSFGTQTTFGESRPVPFSFGGPVTQEGGSVFGNALGSTEGSLFSATETHSPSLFKRKMDYPGNAESRDEAPPKTGFGFMHPDNVFQKPVSFGQQSMFPRQEGGVGMDQPASAFMPFPAFGTPGLHGYADDSVFNTQHDGSNVQLGTGKSLFNGFFEQEDASQAARPSIGYSTPKKEEQDSSIFGSSIFSAFDTDPFERPSRPNRRR